MCAFTGYMINKDERDHLKKMVNNSQQGSDYIDFFADEYLRFSLQKTHSRENSANTLWFENERYCIAFDGQIYNYIKLRNKMTHSEYTFQTEDATEVIVALYDQKKEFMLRDLRGMFSFLIWDKEEMELFGARDPFGIKPLYYINDELGLYCSSEMKTLLRGAKDYEINREALHHYFSFQYVPEPQTIRNSIQKLEAGHFFKKKLGNSLQIEEYCPLEFTPKVTPLDQKIQQIQAALRNSVHLHMLSNAPLGAFLSGGVDSSAIVAFAKEIDPDIKTFTVGFEHDGYSEIDIAKKTAEQLGVENFHYVISCEEFIKELPNVIKHFGSPVADPAAVPLYIASREASKKFDVILSGEGADELFGGYLIYREPNDLKVFNSMPNWLKRILHSFAKHLPDGMSGKSFLNRGTTPLEERYIGNANIFNEEEKEVLLENYESTYNYSKITKPLYDQIPHYSDVQKMQYIDMYTWIRGDILVNADRMTMAHSLELRVPFLDQEVYRVASELKSTESITNRTTKYALREALRGIVPQSVLYNKKLGFPVPLRHWLKDELFNWAKEIIKSSPTDHLIYKPYVLKLLENHRFGKVDNSRKLWTILVFMIWYEKVFLNEANHQKLITHL